MYVCMYVYIYIYMVGFSFGLGSAIFAKDGDSMHLEITAPDSMLRIPLIPCEEAISLVSKSHAHA